MPEPIKNFIDTVSSPIVLRTCADSSFQPVSNLVVKCAVNQFRHWCLW